MARAQRGWLVPQCTARRWQCQRNPIAPPGLCKVLHPLMVSLSNHDSSSGGILRQAQDERKSNRPITLRKA